MTNRMKSFWIIMAGLILVGIAVFVGILLYQRINGGPIRAANEDEVVKTQVVIITRDLFLGDQLSDADVKLSEVPV